MNGVARIKLGRRLAVSAIRHGSQKDCGRYLRDPEDDSKSLRSLGSRHARLHIGKIQFKIDE